MTSLQCYRIGRDAYAGPVSKETAVGRQTCTPVKLIARGPGSHQLRLAPTLGGNAAWNRASSPQAARSALHGRLQLLDLGELARCHLHYQIEDRLLSDFANLYELHGAKITLGKNPQHPP